MTASQIPPGYVEITYLARLWEAVPPGKAIDRKSLRDLRAENEALRQRLAELEAPMKPPGP